MSNQAPIENEAPKPVRIVLRKPLLVGKVNHDRGDIVEVDRWKAKNLVDAHAAYRVDASGNPIPELDSDGDPLPIESLEPTPAPEVAASKLNEAEVF